MWESEKEESCSCYISTTYFCTIDSITLKIENLRYKVLVGHA